MTVHKMDKHWSNDINWGDTKRTALDNTPFDEFDVVISPDPQERLGEDGGYVVSEIYPDYSGECIHQRGLFWHEDYVELFAHSLDEVND